MNLYYRRCGVDLKGEPFMHFSMRSHLRYNHGLTMRLPGNRVVTLSWGRHELAPSR